MDSQRRRSTVEKDLDSDSDKYFIDNASIADCGSSGRLKSKLLITLP